METSGKRRQTAKGRMLRRLAGLVLLLAGPEAAHGHATWGNGSAVPDWVSKACCGPSDAHHLSPDEVHRVTDGYRIHGYPKMVYDFEVLPSQDGEYWAFYSETSDADGQPVFTSIFCFFAPSFG